jgi:glycosyltransferase involved in cell wall biosynthesis
VIGDGPYKRNLKLLSQKLGIFNSVVFEGYVPYEKVPEHLVGSDCFICPLPYRIEWSVSSPIKLFEYLACTKPIILTPIPAHKNIISSNKYIVWTDGDKVHDFTRAIEDAYMNRKILIENSRSALNDIFGKHEWKTQARIFHNYLKGAF